MEQRTESGPDNPVRSLFAIHIPPEEAVALAFFALEVAAGALSRQRNSVSMRMLAIRRDLEFAVAHEGGFRMLFRNTKFLSKL